MLKELYHGTDKDFEKFDKNLLGGSDAIDQYGSGFYFYSVKSKTAMHGSLRLYCNVDINKAIAHDDQLELSFDQIHSLLCACPDLEDKLSNFGDIDYDGFDEVLTMAANQYCDMPFLDSVNMIGNDFFNNNDVHLLLTAFVKETGIDCITDLSRDIYVILTAQQIDITKSINELDDNE